MVRNRVSSKPISLLSHIRFRDSIIFQSPTFVALATFIPNASPTHVAQALILVLGSFLIMAHIFAFNDWADMALDYQNTHKRDGSFVEHGFTSREMLNLASWLAVGGIGAVAVASIALVPIALVMILLGVAYSFPVKGLKAKGIPVLSSILHFAGIVLAFLLGSTAFSAIDSRSVLIGCYFGILITAGHLVQEVQDYADDRRGGIRTNAVQFGQAPMFILSFALFAFSFLFLIALAQAGFIPALAEYSVILFPVYAFWAIKVYRAGLESANVRRLRNQYRILFAVVVLVLLLSAIANKAA
jgi:4-hydroxybenzoate polyprenyltransferase